MNIQDLKQRAAQIIDTEWKSSWYWGKEPNDRHWTMDAKHDCIERIYNAEEELKLLKAMRKELEEIASLYIPETNQPDFT